MNQIFRASTGLVWRHVRTLSFFLFFLFIGGFSTSLISQTGTLTKGVDLSSALTGETLTYTLEFGCSSLTTDCTGAIMVDTIPEEVNYLSSTIAIVTGTSGSHVISPVYDPVSRTVTWDFTTISPEMGLPDGASGSVEVLVQIEPGIYPTGVTVNNKANLITTNAGVAVDTGVTTVDPTTPSWSITKTNTSGTIYHDQDINYEVQLCPDSELGNLHLLPGTVISDVLPDGAVFVSADNGGTESGGTVTWTIADSIKVNEPCRVFNVVVQYPSSHPDNQTGISTIIPKTNTASFMATAVGGAPATGMDTAEDPLNPPFYNTGLTKDVGTEEGTTPTNTTNKFMLIAENNSTVAVDSFTISDTIPAQADILEIQVEPTIDYDHPVNIRVQLDGDPTWINFQSGISSNMGGEFDVTTIPGWIPGTSYVSIVEFNYGTVDPGFRPEMQLIFEPSYPLDNNGIPTEFETLYTNVAGLSFYRPIDDMTFTVGADEQFCVVGAGATRLASDKSVESNYVTTPDGDPTTGNPYFIGSRVAYTLHVENDGGLASGPNDPEITADSSFSEFANPIASDLLPTQMEYEAGSWMIVNNTTDEVWNHTAGNPIFETVDDFNGTGKTLLRWTFTGEMDPGEEFDIVFNATIRDTVPSGREIENNFALTSTNDFFCAGVDCEEPGTNPQLNDFFGTIADPTNLISGISELCINGIMLTVADTTSAPEPIKTVISAGPYSPAESPQVEAGVATDTVAYSIGVCNNAEGNFPLPDPVLVDLLPAELAFIPGTIVASSNTTGLLFDAMPGVATNPTFEVIEDYAGTGRQLLRWKFTGDFPIGKCVDYSFKTNILLGAGGTISNEPYATASERAIECVNGSVVDVNDLDDDGSTANLLCEAASPALISLPVINAMGSEKSVRGVNDAEFKKSALGDLAIGDTDHTSAVDWQIRIFNAGNVTLTDGVVYDILPYLDDTGVQLTGTSRESKWRPILTSPVASPNSNIKIYYSESANPCRPEINPEDGGAGCVDDWTLTPPSNLSLVRALKFDLEDEDLEPAEEYFFEINMVAPDSIQILAAGGRPGIAWNSIARNANEIPAQEPNKVGIEVEGYDVALRKTLAPGQLEFVQPGEDVDFEIKIFNQSSHAIQNIEIKDYIPSGLTLNDADWTSLGLDSALITVVGPLAPDDSLTVEITLTVPATAAVNSTFDNFAEISNFQDMNGGNPTDWDSPNDRSNTNDSGGAIRTAADDVVTGNGQGTIGDGIAATDEDDHDGVRIYVCPAFTPNIAANQYICTDDLTEINDIVVPTTAANTDLVDFVSFSTPQSSPNMYSGGTVLASVNPAGGNVTLTEANIATSAGDHYIYPILNPAPTDPDCRPFDEILVQINPPVAANISSAAFICPGFSTTISATPTGGTGIYTYNWDNGLSGSSSHSVSPTATTTYNVTVTDSGGNCVDMQSVVVTVYPEPSVDAGADQETCQDLTIDLTATPSGGMPGYSYIWSNGAITAMQSPTVTANTTYIVTLTDDNGCRDTSEVDITTFKISAAATPPIICLNDNTNITASIDEGTATAYEWSTGETTPTIQVSPPVDTDYKVLVTHATGCKDSAIVSITVNPLPPADAGPDTETCYGFSTILTASGGVNYSWSTGQMSSATTVSPLVDTKYYVTVTDGNNCMNIDSVTVTVNNSPVGSISSTNETCSYNNDGTASAGITTSTESPYTYNWSNGEMTSDITNLVADTYIVTVTDANGCRDTITSVVSQPDTLIPNLSMNQDTCQMSLGSAISGVTGGSPMYNYLWSNGATTPTNPNLPIGNYTLTVTDANSCIVIDSIEVSEIDTCYSDLALKKVLDSTPPIFAGKEVRFKITVYNQGTIEATQVEVKDYFPSEMLLTDTDWTLESATVAVDTVPFIAAKDSVEIFISFQIHSGFRNATNTLINNAEITSAIGEPDQDSPLSNTNDGTTNELATDDNVNDESPWTVGTADNPSDEDDYDATLINIVCKEPICVPIGLKINEK